MSYKYTVQIDATILRQIEIESDKPLTREDIRRRSGAKFEQEYGKDYDNIEVGDVECISVNAFADKEVIFPLDLCDCGMEFPESGYCKFCGAHSRYKSEA